jgi:hypothetical protein
MMRRYSGVVNAGLGLLLQCKPKNWVDSVEKLGVATAAAAPSASYNNVAISSLAIIIARTKAYGFSRSPTLYNEKQQHGSSSRIVIKSSVSDVAVAAAATAAERRSLLHR